MSRDVTRWLQGLGLGQYSEAFETNAIGWSALAKLDHELLKEIGVTSVGHRIQILEALAGVNSEDPPRRAEPREPVPRGDAERRQLTVMFADLAESTELSQQLDPEALREIIRRYQDTCKTSIERYDGYVARYMGDGVLAYFGYPHAHEDDAERAIHAGLRIVHSIAEWNVASPDHLPIGVRVGIATGPVIVGDLIGEGSSQETAVVGETPNLAARLQGLAKKGNVVVSPSTYVLAGERFQCESLGARPLKGMSEPIEVWRVVAPVTTESRFESSRRTRVSPFVGRAEESLMLQRRLSMARKGEGQVVLITGEAGIGKSRLVQSLLDHLAPNDHLRTYQCSPLHTNTALHPLIAEIERTAKINPADAPAKKLTKLKVFASSILIDDGSEASRILPALLSLSGDDRLSDIEPDPVKRKARIFEFLIGQLDYQSRSELVVCLFEDVHWADPSTIELIGRLVDRISALPVLLIVTSRPGFTAPWTDLPYACVVTLNRLGARLAGEIVTNLAGETRLSQETVQQIVRHTDGVPLFVEELTRTLLERGTFEEGQISSTSGKPQQPLSIPATLQDSLNARLDTLADVKYVAQVAAVIGRNFDYATLSAAAAVHSEHLDSALRKLEHAGLIHALGSTPAETYTFKHALVRDTAYQSLLSTVRKKLHERIATVIEEDFPEQARTDPELVAYHFAEAGFASTAIDYWATAGERSIEASAYLEGIQSITNALSLLGQIPDEAERASKEIALRLSLGVAELQGIGPGSDEALRTYARAESLSRTDATPMQRFDALWGLHFVNMMRGNLEYSRDIGGDLIPYAQALGDEDRVLESHHVQWSTMLALGELEASVEHTSFVIPRYDSERHHWLTYSYGGHDPGVCAHDCGGLAQWLLGFPVQGRSSVTAGVALAERLAHPYTLVEAYMCIGFMDVAEGRTDETGERAEVVEKLVQQSKSPPVAADFIRCIHGAALATSGQIAAGLKIMDETITGITEFGAWGFPISAAYSFTLLEFGRAELALSHIDALLCSEAGGKSHWWLAEFNRARGEILLGISEENSVQATDCFERALRIARAQSNKVHELRACVSLSKLWSNAGKIDQARDLLTPVYTSFTEGHDSTDLLCAAEMLKALA